MEGGEVRLAERTMVELTAISLVVVRLKLLLLLVIGGLPLVKLLTVRG
jgi:hypothetical protein